MKNDVNTPVLIIALIVIIYGIYSIGYYSGHRQGWDDHREAIKPSYLNWSDF